MSRAPRDTLIGAVVGALLFGGVAVIQVIRAGVALGTVIQPVLLFGLIGFTTGGLAGPLVANAWRRKRGG